MRHTMAEGRHADAFARLRTPAIVSVLALLASSCLVTQVSQSSTGGAPDGASSAPSISADGRFVVFESAAANLVVGDTNEMTDVFLRDTLAKTTTRISERPGGIQADGASGRPVITPSGAHVVFESAATNLVDDDGNKATDVFVWTTATQAVERVSVPDGSGEANGASFAPDISDDGQIVVFASAADNLVASDGNAATDVFLRDRAADSTQGQPPGLLGAAPDGGSGAPVVSGDGSTVAFESAAANLVSGDGNGATDVFVWDVAGASVELVSRTAAATAGDGASRDPAIDGTGAVVAFESDATDLVTLDTNTTTDVFVAVQGGAGPERIAPAGVEPDGPSRRPSLSGDGDVVAFESEAANLIVGDGNGVADVYAHRRALDRTVRASHDFVTGESSGASTAASVDVEGEFVAFETAADDLVNNAAANGVPDIVVRTTRDRQITATDPSTLARGQSGTVTLIGTDLDEEVPNATITGGGVAISSVTFVSETTVELDVTVDPAAPLGPRNVLLLAQSGTGIKFLRGALCTGCLTVVEAPEPPEVSVAVTDPIAIEGAAPINPGQVTFTRAGPTDGPLSADYTVGGTASAGDLEPLSGTVTFAPGSPTATVEVNPVDDAETEPPELVEITAAPGPGYTVATAGPVEVTIVDNDPAIELRVNTGNDDAEEKESGDISRSSSILDLGVHTSNGAQTIGIRYTDVPIPQGATITGAWVQFQARAAGSSPTTLDFWAQAADDAPPITTTPFGISTRPRTTATMSWSVPTWSANRDVGPAQRTPELAEVLQEVVARPGWSPGNAMMLLVRGTGLRKAASYNEDPLAAPVLHVEYAGNGAPANTAPSVSVRATPAVWPAEASVDGTVGDDLLPDTPPGLATTWEQVSGPGIATFADPNAVDTSVTFTQPGDYELRLTADDGALTASDSILVGSVDPATPPPEVVRFAAFGDFGYGGTNDALVASLVTAGDPDFIVTLGDNRYIRDYDMAVGSLYADYIGDYGGDHGPGSAVNRFFAALGNHDYDEVGGLDAYLDYFSLPGATVSTSNTSGNERYYDVVQGPVHLFVIDNDNVDAARRSPTAPQGQWLQAALAASTAPWKVVLLHYPPFSSGSGGNGSDPGLQWPYEAWGADVVLAGHSHHYERIDKSGFPYFVVGTGGASISSLGAIEPDSQFVWNDGYGAMFVEACADRIEFEFHSVSGGLLDSLSLGAPDCAPPP